ncbi:MAG: MerR family transcriptional regulator [Myxococcota bacterium]|nr:MerR family transcriptional regulator [Myxococcota bacterium]MEC8423599.1 MerR family transcriptional regulator [Myxococcota bacterium]
MAAPPSFHPGPYRIGQASSMAGVSVNTIRTWERRYGLVQPERSAGGTRTYSAEQVERLRLARTLTHQGHAIGMLADLSTEQLRERAATLHTVARGPSDEGFVVVAHPGLPMDGAPSALRVVRTLSAIPAFGMSAIVVQIDLLGNAPIARVASIRERHPGIPLAVLAPIVSRRRRGALEAAGATVIRGPMRRDDLLTVARGLQAAPPDPAPEPPSISKQTLQRLLELQHRVTCECPEHLARITLSAIALEEYSNQCVETSPVDAALHRDLARAMADVRARLEALVYRVCEHDGIPLGPLPGDRFSSTIE